MDHDDENDPQHGDAPFLACLKRRNPGSWDGFASQPRRRCVEALPQESHRHPRLSTQGSLTARLGEHGRQVKVRQAPGTVRGMGRSLIGRPTIGMSGGARAASVAES
jgi:hypothetical protein